MKRKMEEDKDDMKINMKNELICLILRKMYLMTLMNSFLQMAKMAVNDGLKTVGDWA